MYSVLFSSTKVEIQHPLKGFPNSYVSSFLICNGLMPGRASDHQKLTPIPMDRQLPDGDWSSSGRVGSWQVSTMVVCLPWGNRSTLD